MTKNLAHIKDKYLTALELADKYATEFSWGECPKYPRSEWIERVQEEDTLQGYWDRVVSQF